MLAPLEPLWAALLDRIIGWTRVNGSPTRPQCSRRCRPGPEGVDPDSRTSGRWSSPGPCRRSRTDRRPNPRRPRPNPRRPNHQRYPVESANLGPVGAARRSRGLVALCAVLGWSCWGGHPGQEPRTQPSGWWGGRLACPKWRSEGKSGSRDGCPTAHAPQPGLGLRRIPGGRNHPVPRLPGIAARASRGRSPCSAAATDASSSSAAFPTAPAPPRTPRPPGRGSRRRRPGRGSTAASARPVRRERTRRGRSRRGRRRRPGPARARAGRRRPPRQGLAHTSFADHRHRQLEQRAGRGGQAVGASGPGWSAPPPYPSAIAKQTWAWRSRPARRGGPPRPAPRRRAEPHQIQREPSERRDGRVLQQRGPQPPRSQRAAVVPSPTGRSPGPGRSSSPSDPAQPAPRRRGGPHQQRRAAAGGRRVRAS